MPDPNLPRVLIVDDEGTNIRVLNELLKSDYEVLFSTNGADAIDVATKENPDIILLDIMMPDMDGFEVCKILKSTDQLKDIPVIFVSSMDDTQDEAKGLDLGAIDYVMKPVSPAIVKVRVRNHVESKRNRDALARLAQIDGLTGIPNRRSFDERLEVEWSRAKRSGNGIALILMDIDHFKQFNDTYGHLEGDACLKKVADALENSIERTGDFVARYGGEEFVCVLPETDQSGALNVAERLRDAVAKLKTPHESSSVTDHVTISLGLAFCAPAPDSIAEDLLKSADEYLYQAKTNGRNRIASQ